MCALTLRSSYKIKVYSAEVGNTRLQLTEYEAQDIDCVQPPRPLRKKSGKERLYENRSICCGLILYLV